MKGNPFSRARRPAAPPRPPGNCRACSEWTDPNRVRFDREAGRCRNAASPYAGLPRIGWMGCIAFTPRNPGKNPE